MGHTLVLELPEDLYKPLLQKAKQAGSTPEELAIKWLVSVIHNIINDPVENFIGAFSSDVSDWSDQHDKYLGKALMKKMSNKESKRS